MNNDDESNNVWQQFEQFIQEKILVNSPAKEEQKKKMYLCKYIKLDIPKFDIFFVDNKPKLRLSCLCNNNYELSFEQVFLNYTVDYDIKRNYDDYFFCQLPGHDSNEFECYCEICKKNLCSLCNKKFRVCPHKEDYLFNFNQNYEDYKVFGQSIKNELNKKKISILLFQSYLMLFMIILMNTKIIILISILLKTIRNLYLIENLIKKML